MSGKVADTIESVVLKAVKSKLDALSLQLQATIDQNALDNLTAEQIADYCVGETLTAVQAALSVNLPLWTPRYDLSSMPGPVVNKVLSGYTNPLLTITNP